MRAIPLMLIATACAMAASTCPASPAPPSLPGAWNRAFDEEFNAPLDPRVWVSGSLWGATVIPGDGEVWDSSAVSVSNGLLSLTARQQSLAPGYNYVSGVIHTGPFDLGHPTGYSFLYGYAEASIKVVSGKGLWPAFWMLPDPSPGNAW